MFANTNSRFFYAVVIQSVRAWVDFLPQHIQQEARHAASAIIAIAAAAGGPARPGVACCGRVEAIVAQQKRQTAHKEARSEQRDQLNDDDDEDDVSAILRCPS